MSPKDRLAVRLGKMHPEARRSALMLVALAADQGIPLRVTSTYRSMREQDRLYAIGRTTPGRIVTRARAGHSWHNFGLALDVVPMHRVDRLLPFWRSRRWRQLGEMGESLGFVWGGRWQHPDRPHFHLTLGKTLSELRALKARPNEPTG